MTTTTPAPTPASARTRTGWRIAGAVVAVGLVAAGIGAAVLGVSGRTPGQLLAQAEGRARYVDAARASDLPADLAPAWLPAAASDIRAVQPGGRTDATAVRLSATVDEDAAVPASCDPVTDGPYTIPFDGAADWPDLRYASRYVCGEWTLVDTPTAKAAGHVWYLWRD